MFKEGMLKHGINRASSWWTCWLGFRIRGPGLCWIGVSRVPSVDAIDAAWSAIVIREMQGTCAASPPNTLSAVFGPLSLVVCDGYRSNSAWSHGAERGSSSQRLKPLKSVCVVMVCVTCTQISCASARPQPLKSHLEESRAYSPNCSLDLKVKFTSMYRCFRLLYQSLIWSCAVFTIHFLPSLKKHDHIKW